MLSCEEAKVLRSASVALIATQRSFSVVLPSRSVRVVVDSVSSGQVALRGWRVTPRFASEKDTTTTRFSGGTISRKGQLPHISGPSGEFMQYGNSPPARKSSEHTRMAQPFGPNHCLKRHG